MEFSLVDYFGIVFITCLTIGFLKLNYDSYKDSERLFNEQYNREKKDLDEN